MFNSKWRGDIAKDVSFSNDNTLITAGPCMLESYELGLRVGNFLKEKCAEHKLPYIFKSSYDKANRTSQNSDRGPGLKKGIDWLYKIKTTLNVPILTDVHSIEQIKEVGEFVDIIQIPAFLCKQRELLITAAQTNKVIQIKKSQWANAREMVEIANFVISCGNPKVILVERGSCFGYNDLVVDFRNLVDMKKENHAVVYDATHSVQLPGGNRGKSSGRKDMVHPLTKAALAIGVNGIFLEVHENPEKALSDAETQICFTEASKILSTIKNAKQMLKSSSIN